MLIIADKGRISVADGECCGHTQACGAPWRSAASHGYHMRILAFVLMSCAGALATTLSSSQKLQTETEEFDIRLVHLYRGIVVRSRERESVCVCVCVCEREIERERERERERD